MGTGFGASKSVSRIFNLIVCIGELAGQTFSSYLFNLVLKVKDFSMRLPYQVLCFLSAKVGRTVNLTKESFCQLP